MKSMRVKKQRGVILIIDVLISAIMLSILAAMAVVPLMKLRATQYQTDAEARVRQFGNLKTQLGLCAMTVGCISNQTVLSVVNATETNPDTPVVLGGYTFTYSPNTGGDGAYQYVAVPNSAGYASFSVDDSNVLHFSRTGAASFTSPVCPF